MRDSRPSEVRSCLLSVNFATLAQHFCSIHMLCAVDTIVQHARGSQDPKAEERFAASLPPFSAIRKRAERSDFGRVPKVEIGETLALYISRC